MSAVRLAAVAWTLLLAALLLAPGDAVPPAPGLAAADLWIHAALFAVEAALLTVALGGRFAVVTALVAALAVGTEAAQLAVPGRTAAFGDLAADLAGAAVGMAVAALRRRGPAL